MREVKRSTNETGAVGSLNTRTKSISIKTKLISRKETRNSDMGGPSKKDTPTRTGPREVRKTRCDLGRQIKRRHRNSRGYNRKVDKYKTENQLKNRRETRLGNKTEMQLGNDTGIQITN